MSDKRLIYSIIQHLKGELATLSQEAGESIEVAIQCLENAYEIHAEDPTLDVGTSLKDIFANFIKPVEASPADKAEAERLKTEGNELIKQEDYAGALDCYTKAIKLDPNNPVYFCNRAAAYSRLNNHSEAIADCNQALKIDPTYSKAYGRLGLAYSCIKEYDLAKVNYKKALELEPGNQTYINNLEINEEQLKNQPASSANGLLNRMPGGLDFNQLLNNPALMTMASQLLSDPAMQNMMGSLMSGNVNENSNGMEALLTAGQRLAQHMQQTNPDLVDQLRRQMNNGDNAPNQPEN